MRSDKSKRGMISYLINCKTIMEDEGADDFKAEFISGRKLQKEYGKVREDIRDKCIRAAG